MNQSPLVAETKYTVPASRPFVPADARTVAFEKWGTDVPRSKDDINAELLGLDRL